nr:50S ribosomal protein [Ipomoea batatas]
MGEEEHCAVAMATTSSLHLLLIFLCFSHLLIPMAAAIPLTRSRNLQTQEYEEPSYAHKVPLLNLMFLQSLKSFFYPGSGANHRHTPWVPPARACLDC